MTIPANSGEIPDRNGYESAELYARERKERQRAAAADLDALAESIREAGVIEVHHHDIEQHAVSFNEGYEAAMAQHLADDPSVAQDWLDENLAEAWDKGHESGYWNGRQSSSILPHDHEGPMGIDHAKANNPYRES